MNNLKDYEDFLNEGWFNRSSKYSDSIDKICKYVTNVNVNNLTYVGGQYGAYSFSIKGKKMNKESDPYGEENDEDDVVIRVETDGDPRLWVDEVQIPATCKEISKISKIIKYRIENKNRDELNAKLRKALDKL